MTIRRGSAEMEKLYRVKFEVDVTAASEAEAVEYAIDDIKECYNDGTLEAEITELDEPDDVTEVE
jgi:hypothetical protein